MEEPGNFSKSLTFYYEDIARYCGKYPKKGSTPGSPKSGKPLAEADYSASAPECPRYDCNLRHGEIYTGFDSEYPKNPLYNSRSLAP